MNPESHFVLFGDGSWPAESIAKVLPGDSVCIWIDGKGWVLPGKNRPKNEKKATCSTSQDAAKACNLDEHPVAIIGFEDKEKTHEISEVLRSRYSDIKILQLSTRDSTVAVGDVKRSVSWKDLVHRGVEAELEFLSLQEKVRDLRKIFSKDLNVAILIQADPDPDAMASAVALRKLLGRKAQRMPIVSFDGRITRSENRAMAKLLDIEVIRVDHKTLAGYDRVVLVDCQPSFFPKNTLPKIHAVLDHHPLHDAEGLLEQVDIVEIRPELGSTSTLLSMLLDAAKVELSQRTATALLYGIKSDTLLLNREASSFDIEAFLKLYPQANISLLKRIERPELPISYIKCLQKAFEFLKVKDGISILPLGEISSEDWIPQAADFALQVEGAKWGMAIGHNKNHMIISGRNCGYVHHCGDVFKSILGRFGSAGGHRSLAKAVIDKKNWLKNFGKNSLDPKRLNSILRRLLKEELQHQL